MSYNYIDTPNPNLVCCICRAPFVNPHTTRTCAHTFCRECILAALEVTPQCPIDRSALRAENLAPADPVLRNLVDELMVECPNSGCAETPQRQLLDAHVREKCEYAEVRCPDGICDKLVPRKDGARHARMHGQGGAVCEECGVEISAGLLESHTEVCDKQPWTCPACLSVIPGGTSRSAHTDICPDTIVPCTHLSHGCSWTGRRTSLHSAHIPTCSYESIKGFFAIHESQTRNLEEENAKLKHQISVMQGMMSMMQRELSEVKRVLGPWFREDGDGGGASPVVQYTEDITRDMAAFVDPSPGSYLSLASYFPPAEDEYAHPESSRASTSTSPAFRPRPPPLQPSQAPQPQPPLSSTSTSTSTVAPLTISPTLYGTLTSLHSSVVSLASSLESLGRHQDVALTTEAMRMGEEVRSLRAVVSGLRMQVHAIMVDRSGGGGGREVQPGPVLVGNLPQHPGGEQGSWPLYYGMPRFPSFGSAPQGVSAGQQPVTKL